MGKDQRPDRGPPETDIDLVVVHGISLPPRVYGGIDRLLSNTLDPDAHRGGLGDMDMM